MSDNPLYAVWLSRKFSGASTVLTRLLDFFPTISDIYLADEEKYRETEALTDEEISALSDKDTKEAQGIIEKCVSEKIQLITYEDELYPKRLKTIDDPPPVLYCLGSMPNFNKKFSLSIVGARNMSPYGADICSKIASDIAVGGGIVVSGLALGVDAMATASALTVDGISVAIVAFGVDIIYPKVHKKLREELLKNGGAIISEYPPGFPLNKSNFRERNRLFGGISNCSLIIEGRAGSGTSLTASHLLKQGKPVYVVPSNVTQANAELSVELMKSGVKPIATAYDILVHHEEECFSTINPAKIESKRLVTVKYLVNHYSLGVKMSSYEYERPYEEREEARNRGWIKNMFRTFRRTFGKKDEIDFKPTLPEPKKDKALPSESELREIGELAYKLYQIIREGECDIDELITNHSGTDVLSALTMLELHGHIVTLEGNRVKTT